METTFPIPEREAEKLASVKEEIRNRPFYLRVDHMIRGSTIPFVAAAAIAGVLIGVLIGRR